MKAIACPHCAHVIDAEALIDGPSYVEHGSGRWCPSCKGPLDRKAVSKMSFAYGVTVGGGDGARDSMMKNIGEFEDKNLPAVVS